MSAQVLPLRGQGRTRTDYSPRTRFGPVGIGVMVGFHALLGWALVSGLGKHAIEIVKKPLPAAIVEEVRPPPPPPPRPIVKQEAPKLQAPQPPPAYAPPPEVAPPPATEPAPTISAVQSTDPVVPPAQPATPPPPAPMPATPRPERLEVGVACPGYREALQSALTGVYEKVRVVGTVKVRFVLRDTRVSEVAVLSGPREYQRAVQAAVRRFECRLVDGEAAAVEFDVAFRD